jgi:hypothetical protein
MTYHAAEAADQNPDLIAFETPPGTEGQCPAADLRRQRQRDRLAASLAPREDGDAFEVCSPARLAAPAR